MTSSKLDQPVSVASAPPQPLRSSLRWFGLCTLVGVGAGLGAIVFFELSHRLADFLMGLAGYYPVGPRGETSEGLASRVTAVFDYAAPRLDWRWALALPTLGGLIVGWLISRFAPEAKGHGTDAAVDAFHRKKGLIRPSVIWVKTVASAITLGTGGSGGREGPIAQIGAGFGSWLASALGLTWRERRILLAVGMGAGVGAIFRAPLAGALFAAEIMYSRTDFESEVILPSIIACVVSFEVFTSWVGTGTLFATNLIPNAQYLVFESPLELLPYSVLGLILAGLGHLYVRTFYGTEALFERARIPPWLKPAIGGALTGTVALAFWAIVRDGRAWNVLAFGYGVIQEGFDLPAAAERLPPTVAFTLAATFMGVAMVKIITTSLTIGSGGSAGVFGPSMVIGGAAGGAVGIVFQQLWPEVVRHPGTFTIVGMAAFFTGVAKVPISTLIMVSEITGNYRLLLPVMWVETITYALTRRCSIYRSQVPYRKDSPAHRGDLFVDVLEGLRVEDIAATLREPVLVGEAIPLRQIIEIVDSGTSQYFPVVDDSESMVGVFSINDIRRYLHDENVWDLLVARDVMNAPVITLRLDDDLGTALRRFTKKNIDEIPVVAAESSGRVLGMLRRREVIAAYNQRLDAEKAIAV